MADKTQTDKRRSMVVGVALYDDEVVPRFCYGCFYSKLKIEGVVAMEAILDNPEVQEAYDNFMKVFGEAASDLGLEAAMAAGADAEQVKKVAEYKQQARNRNKGGGNQPQRGRNVR